MTQSQDERLGLPSASSWRRYELCAGSWQLETEARVLGQSAHETSPQAERGALIHAWLAGAVDEDGNEIKLDDSEQQTADFLQERAQEQVTRIFGDEPTQELAEKRLWLTVNGRKAASGRFDRCIYTPTVALVQDFKTGFSQPEPAEQNAQMKMLAVLVALHMPSMLREVVVQIISGPFGVKEARYDMAALAKAYNEILATLRAIQDPLAPLAPSPEACRFCPAILVCQAVKNLVMPVAKTQVSALPDGARGAKLLDEVAILEKHFKEIKKYYEGRCVDPTYNLPNYGLIPGNEVREIIDWKKAEMRLAEYLDTDQLKEAQSYTIGKLETALAKSLKLTAEQAKEKLNQILDGLIIKNQNKSSLKRIGKPKLVSLMLP
jgi:RecB family exonuclease